MIESIYQQYLKTPTIQTDTRKLEEGEIFFALKGPNFNADDFVEDALEKGASLVVCEKYSGNDERVLVVEDSLKALQDLAGRHRDTLSIPVIGITGSNGKTTTKELIHGVLSTTFKTYTTQGNLNNHIGVPLTILKIRNNAEMAVVEMGANHLGEIASYCLYAKPNYGLITNIGKAHLEGFGGPEKVKVAKGELFSYLTKHAGTAFVNTDDPAVAELAQTVETVLTYGRNGREAAGQAVESNLFLKVQLDMPFKAIIETRLVGGYNLPNVLAAVCVGSRFGVAPEKIVEALENYVPGNSRSQFLEKNGNQIILDAYNANPGSMKAAIENFSTFAGENKILLLGEMKELGADSAAEHQRIAGLIQKYSWEKVVLVGEAFRDVEGEFLHFSTSEEAKEWYAAQKLSGKQILVKGSRSMRMETVIED